LRDRLVAFGRTPYAPILLAFVLLRAGGFYGVQTVRYQDTAGYLEVASHSVFSLGFLAGGRSWAVPLLWKVLPDSDSARATGQFGLSLVCWPLLAAALARALRPSALRWVAFALVLLFSLSLAVIRWDTVMLSESVSISLTVLVLAGWLELVRAPRPWLVGALLAATLVWVFARDSNGIVALVTVPLALYWVWRPGELGRRWAAALAVGTLVIFALGVLATTTDQAQLRRNERPILHVVGRRVLGDQAKTRWWRDHGMPAPSPRVLRERRSLAGIAEGSLPTDPRTDRFLTWTRDHGRGTLFRYLLTHPAYTVKSTIGQRQRLLGGVTGGYMSPDARIVVPAPLDRLIYPRTAQDVYFWLIVIGVGAAAVALAAGPRRAWLVPAVALVAQVPHALVVYHGDTLEVPRHAMLVAITTRLALLMLALLALDRLLEARGGRMFDGRRATTA
jgi:hypothetical protein